MCTLLRNVLTLIWTTTSPYHWRYYLTANSCSHEGYAEYNWPDGWKANAISADLCGTVSSDGEGIPEQFWCVITKSLLYLKMQSFTPLTLHAHFATRRNCAEVKILQNTNISNSSPSLPTNRPTFLEQSNSAAITVGLPTSTTTTASNNSPSSGKLHDKTIVGYYASWQWVQMVSVFQLIFISKDFVLTNSLSHRSLSFFYRWYDRWVSMQFEPFSLASSDKNAYGCYLIVQLLCSRCNRNKLAEPANMDFRVSMR